MQRQSTKKASNPLPARDTVPEDPARPLSPRRLYEEVCEQLVAIVHREKLKPGQRLPPERELARELKVSRTSIREAMIALEMARIIEVRLGSGCYLTVAIGPNHQFPWTRQADPGPGAIEQFEVRKLVEPRVAQLAAKLITAEEIADLEHLLEADARIIVTNKPGEQEGAEFHIRLAEYSRNSILARLVRDLMALRAAEMWRMLRTRVITSEMRLQSLLDRRQIVEALKAHDPARAKRAMQVLLRRAETWFFSGPA